MNICKLAINHVLCVALLCGSALAYKCSEDFYCEDGRLGIGGYYSSFGSNAVTSDNVGGYLSLSDDHYFKWFYFGGVVRGGYGASYLDMKQGGASKKDTNQLLAVEPRIGINLGSLRTPTFIYFAMPLESYDVALDDTNTRFANYMFFIGGGIFNRTLLTQTFGLESRVSFTTNVRHRYYVSDARASKRFDGSYRIEASFGILRRGNAMAQEVPASQKYF